MRSKLAIDMTDVGISRLREPLKSPRSWPRTGETGAYRKQQYLHTRHTHRLHKLGTLRDCAAEMRHPREIIKLQVLLITLEAIKQIEKQREREREKKNSFRITANSSRRSRRIGRETPFWWTTRITVPQTPTRFAVVSTTTAGSPSLSCLRCTVWREWSISASGARMFSRWSSARFETRRPIHRQIYYTLTFNGWCLFWRMDQSVKESTRQWYCHWRTLARVDGLANGRQWDWKRAATSFRRSGCRTEKPRKQQQQQQQHYAHTQTEGLRMSHC